MVISRVISRITVVITYIRVLITLLITTHEPPSTYSFRGFTKECLKTEPPEDEGSL